MSFSGVVSHVEEAKENFFNVSSTAKRIIIFCYIPAEIIHFDFKFEFTNRNKPFEITILHRLIPRLTYSRVTGSLSLHIG